MRSGIQGDSLKEEMEMCTTNLAIMQSEMEQLKRQVKTLYGEPMQKMIQQKTIKSGVTDMSDSLIATPSQRDWLKLQFSPNKDAHKYTLLYRGSRDGWMCADFHR